MINIFDNYIKIDSSKSSLILRIREGFCEIVHYGNKLKDNKAYSFFSRLDTKNYVGAIDDYIQFCSALTSTGDACNSENYLCVTRPDGVFVNRFRFYNAEIVEDFDTPLGKPHNNYMSVKITYKDEISSATLNQYFTLFESSNVIGVHSEIINTSDDYITVNRLMSCQLELYGENAKIYSFDGTWFKERSQHITTLNGGRFEIDSKVGISSGTHNPFFITQINDKFIGLNLIYSGNHKEIVEISPFRKVKILTGMNDYNFNYRLEQNEKLVSPQAVFVCGNSIQEISDNMHDFCLHNIVPEKFAYSNRPILLNSWEGSGFDFDGEKLYLMAKISKEVGIELFVLDDGWFGKRNDDTTSLGDWFDNVEKAGGLKHLSEKIKSLGIKFGIWVEPEMISKKSVLYSKHPEYAMQIPNIEPIERRNQLMLDLANDEVVDYLADTLINLFK